jgi:hypothetical protein
MAASFQVVAYTSVRSRGACWSSRRACIWGAIRTGALTNHVPCHLTELLVAKLFLIARQQPVDAPGSTARRAVRARRGLLLSPQLIQLNAPPWYRNFRGKLRRHHEQRFVLQSSSTAIRFASWQSGPTVEATPLGSFLLNRIPQVMRTCAVCALRAVCACGMSMSCVHTAHVVCACVSGGTACFIGIVCVRECGPVRVSGASDRGPTQATLIPPATAQ